MKLFMTFIAAALLGLSGSFAFADDATGRYAADRPMTQPGDAEDVFIARAPAGAKLAAKDDQVKDVKVKDLVGTSVVMERTDEELGKVKGVIVDGYGKPLALVMQVNEGPGITAQDVAVKWKAVRSEHDPQDRVVVNVDVAIDQLRHAPAFAGI